MGKFFVGCRADIFTQKFIVFLLDFLLDLPQGLHQLFYVQNCLGLLHDGNCALVGFSRSGKKSLYFMCFLRFLILALSEVFCSWISLMRFFVDEGLISLGINSHGFDNFLILFLGVVLFLAEIVGVHPVELLS